MKRSNFIGSFNDPSSKPLLIVALVSVMCFRRTENLFQGFTTRLVYPEIVKDLCGRGENEVAIPLLDLLDRG